MKKPIAIYGAGGLGKEIFALIRALPDWEVIGFYDDGVAFSSPVREGVYVLGGLADLLEDRREINIVLAIGAPEVKLRFSKSIGVKSNIRFPSLVHPSAILMDTANITFGPGCIIGAGCILTTDINFGAHVLLNLNCTVGHDVRIGNCTSVMPGVNIAGEVNIGDSVLIGSGTNLINRLTVGDNCKIGAGAVVIDSIPANSTAVGVPAKVIKSAV